MDDLVQLLTRGRDALGVTSLLIACNSIHFFETLREHSPAGGWTVDALVRQAGISRYFLEPIMEVCERIGLVQRDGGAYKLRDADRFDYHRKMMDALPLYHCLNRYFERAQGQFRDIPFHFNQYITSASSRLATAALGAARNGYNQIGDSPITVLDIGCGRGDYLITLCQMNPHATGIGVEMDVDVADMARSAVRDCGAAQRVRILTGDMRQREQELPTDCDIVMMNHIYHVVGPEVSADLTTRSIDHLRPGGLLLNLEICRDYPSTEALIPVLFDALMRFYYAENHAKCFSKEEIERIMRASGYLVDEASHVRIADFDTPNMVYFVGKKR